MAMGKKWQQEGREENREAGIGQWGQSWDQLSLGLSISISGK